MPVTKVRSPDGRVIQVSHPEGASQDEIIAYAQRSSMPAAKADNQPSTGQRRDMMGGGTLQFGPIDTGINTPQWLDEFLAGTGRRMTEIGTLGTHKPDPLADKMLDDSLPATLGGMVVDVGAMLLGGSALKAGAAIPKVGAALEAAGTALSAPTSIKSGVAAAGTYGALTDPDRTSGAIGAGLGQGVGQGVTKLAGKVASPYIKQSARNILDSGGTLTPGEMLGGAFQRAEDAAVSVPVLGDAIKNAKRRSLEGYSKKVINDALSVVGKSLDDGVKPGREAIAAAQDALSGTYDDILKKMTVTADRQFADDLVNLDGLAKQLPDAQYRKFQQIVNDKLVSRFDNPNQKLLGETFKETDSALRYEYKRFIKSADPMNQDLGDALRTAHKALLDLGRRQNPAAATELASADKAYSMLSRANEAANYVGAQDGIFTPSHMLNAVKKNSSKRQFARGDGFGQAETEAAKDMLAQTVPDSGTPARMLFNLGLLGGGSMLNPAATATLLGGAGVYTKAGQKVITPLLAGGQAWRVPMRKGIENMTPMSGLLGAAGGIQVVQ